MLKDVACIPIDISEGPFEKRDVLRLELQARLDHWLGNDQAELGKCMRIQG